MRIGFCKPQNQLGFCHLFWPPHRCRRERKSLSGPSAGAACPAPSLERTVPSPGPRVKDNPQQIKDISDERCKRAKLARFTANSQLCWRREDDPRRQSNPDLGLVGLAFVSLRRRGALLGLLGQRRAQDLAQ